MDYSPWNSLGQSTGVGSLSLLQRIFPTQGSNPDLRYCRQILYQVSHKGSPRILEWVVCCFSRGSSWPRNPTGVSRTAGRFFTNWAMREAHKNMGVNHKEDKDLKIPCWSLPIFFKTKKFLQISTHKVKTVYKHIRLCLSLCLNRQDKQHSSWVRNSSRDSVMNDR